MRFKLIISAGCSFTQVPNRYENWPKHLSEILNIEPLYLGSGSASNGIICKKLIYNVSNLLKTYNPEDLLVGVMWSGPDRHEIYSTDKDFPHFDKMYGNPLSISGTFNWYLLNHFWTDQSSTLWYKHFHDKIGSTIMTIQNILQIQWFLQLKNVKYFMTTYAPHTLPKEDLNHEDIKPFYDLIDFSNFLPVTDALTWMINSGKWHKNEEDGHPPTEANLYFTETVIIPHLKNKGYID